MTIAVRPSRTVASARSTRASVSGSRLAVASSSTITDGSASRALANATSCRSPAENRPPRSRTSVSSRSGRVLTQSAMPTASQASQISSSEMPGRAYRRLSRSVPLKRNPSWGMSTRWSGRDSRAIDRRSCPSMVTRPTSGS